MQKIVDYLPVIVALLLILPVGFFLFNLPSTANFVDSPVGFEECNSGEVRSCTNDESCSGTQHCVGGSWSKCSVERVCVPGTKIDCGLGCNIGYQECNSCGSGFLECVYR